MPAPENSLKNSAHLARAGFLQQIEAIEKKITGSIPLSPEERLKLLAHLINTKSSRKEQGYG